MLVVFGAPAVAVPYAFFRIAPVAVVTAVAIAIGLFVNGLGLAEFKCPRCGKRFAEWIGITWWCVHCGLKVGEADDET